MMQVRSEREEVVTLATGLVHGTILYFQEMRDVEFARPVVGEIVNRLVVHMQSKSHTERVAAAIRRWKEKLLDLTKRNRALNFKPNKVSTVTIVDELPGQVFSQLSVREGSMRFKAMLPEPPNTPAGRVQRAAVAELLGNGSEAEILVDVADVDDGIELPPPLEDEDLDPNRHYDDVLQAHASPSALDKSLRRLSEQAQTTIEEQGVNALYLSLGMLHYRTPLEPDRELRAPVVLLPVTLSRRSAGAGFTVRAGDDEPVVNPSLAEYLRQNFGYMLPTLPDAATMREDYDLQTILDEVAALVKDKKEWTVTSDIYLGLFSFQKLAMYRDLEANAERFLSHPLIRQIVTREGSHIAGLPSDVRLLDLDSEFAPEATAQVVDADSSQLRAIAAVAKGHDLVLEGPPGTGKSQTITNLIAQALADGKSVLFVAEKMAALNVVHRRLSEAGLGDFCLELHSTKSNKRAVLQSIKAALDASIQTPVVSMSASERLPQLRATLTEYANAVHTPHGALGLSPYQAYGELGAVLSAPKVRYARQVNDLTRAQVIDAVQALEVLAKAVAELGDPTIHPWQDTSRTFYAQSDLDDVEDVLADLVARIPDVLRVAADVEQAFGLPRITRLGDIRTALALAEVLEKSPGAPAGVLTSDAWNAPPPQARDLVARGRTLAGLRERLEPKLKPEAFEAEHAADIAFIEEKEAGFFRWLNFLNGRYRLIKKRWSAYRLPGYEPALDEQAEEMKRADALRRERQALREAEADARQLFGALWQGESSDWEALEGYIAWVVEFRSACVKHGLKEQAAATASQPRPDISLVRTLAGAGDELRELLSRLRGLVGWADSYLADATLEEWLARLQAMLESIDRAPRWASYEAARAAVASGLAAELLPHALSGEIAFEYLPGAFRRAFYQRWLDGVVQERPLLREFQTLSHEQRLAEFQALDRRILYDNRAKLLGTLRDRTQQRLQSAEARTGLGFLRSQLARQRGHAPLRRTLQSAGTAVRAIKPCFLMSPLTVAQLLDGDAEPFDLVVFDEASQLTSEDAIGAIMRGRQLVVVGDPKQLPPTNFFAVATGQVTAETDENGDPVVAESESVLEECLGAGLPQTGLKWHYRSREESLITFSNASFYGSDLLTFPSVYTDAHARGLRFEYVASGLYEGAGLNLGEARRIADAVVHHAKTQPEISLGVGTFNLRQQIAILDELELRRRQDPSLEPFFSPGRDEPFFVKNLENIQGDERDVIFLSVTYAKGKDGVLRHNFGPINGENGWRRLNVITTRARMHMRVFSSMRGYEIDLTRTSSVGARLLREFLLYAERGHLDSVIVNQAAETDSAFEADVLRELTLRGLRLQPQVGVAGYRIDLGVLDDEIPGRFICGIECDGAAYHSSQTARDRDRLRQQVLESRGWTIHRLWSTDWFKDRQGQIERLVKLVEESRKAARRPAEEAVPEPDNGGISVVARPDTDTPPAAPDAVEAIDVNGEIPVAEPYVQAELNGALTPGIGMDFHEISVRTLMKPLEAIVKTEAPLHIDDLASRLASAYGNRRVGSRIAEHVDRLCRYAENSGFIRRRGDFIWGTSDDITIRSRAGTGITMNRVASEEIQAGIVAVLSARGALDRTELISEVRALFGYGRTGAQVAQVIQVALDDLIRSGDVGEGGAGLVLRQ